jgi:sirohydrochlorin ferrochelatase
MTIALIDNGSLAAAAHRQLRATAAALSAQTGAEIHAISWQHSDRVPAAALDGAPAWTLAPWVRAQLARGEDEFLFVPFFISAQGAIGSALRDELEELRRDVREFAFRFTTGLSTRGVLAPIAAERIREAIAAHGLRAPAVLVVDHGGPSAASATLRDEVAHDVRSLLGAAIGSLAAASLEGADYAHCRPLLADALTAPGFDRGDVVIAPLFLAPGRHAGPRGDLAQIARATEDRAATTLRCHFTELVGTHPRVVETLAAALRDSLAVSPDSISAPAKPLHKNEQLKAESNFLRGHILRDLADTSTGGITEESSQLTKFHGIYGQDDRDLRNQRRKEGKEKAFSFMARVRVPGGVCTPAQWLALDAIADTYANGTLKLTTRQAFQFHGILKGHLWRAVHEVNRSLLDTLAACGDVNRNVMCNPNPEQSALHAETLQLARALSDHLLPRTRAYHEIWVGDDLVAGGEPEAEPLYGPTYLPRKCKSAVAVPPSNDVDVFAHDIELSARPETAWAVSSRCLRSSASIRGRLSGVTPAIIRFWFAVRRKSPEWARAISRSAALSESFTRPLMMNSVKCAVPCSPSTQP